MKRRRYWCPCCRVSVTDFVYAAAREVLRAEKRKARMKVSPERRSEIAHMGGRPRKDQELR